MSKHCEERQPAPILFSNMRVIGPPFTLLQVGDVSSQAFYAEFGDWLKKSVLTLDEIIGITKKQLGKRYVVPPIVQYGGRYWT